VSITHTTPGTFSAEEKDEAAEREEERAPLLKWALLLLLLGVLEEVEEVMRSSVLPVKYNTSFVTWTTESRAALSSAVGLVTGDKRASGLREASGVFVGEEEEEEEEEEGERKVEEGGGGTPLVATGALTPPPPPPLPPLPLKTGG
jgi:hypothetical protein